MTDIDEVPDYWEHGDPCPNCDSSRYSEKVVAFGTFKSGYGFDLEHIGQELDVFCESCGQHLLSRTKDEAGR